MISTAQVVFEVCIFSGQGDLLGGQLAGGLQRSSWVDELPTRIGLVFLKMHAMLQITLLKVFRSVRCAFCMLILYDFTRFRCAERPFYVCDGVLSPHSYASKDKAYPEDQFEEGNEQKLSKIIKE